MRHIFAMTFADEVKFESEVDPQVDYDDVLLPRTAVSEQRESFSIPVPTYDSPLLISNHEARAQKEV